MKLEQMLEPDCLTQEEIDEDIDYMQKVIENPCYTCNSPAMINLYVNAKQSCWQCHVDNWWTEEYRHTNKTHIKGTNGQFR